MKGWVIKNQAGEYLWVTPEGAFAWTASAKWALRMSREQDAQMLSVAHKNVGEVGRQASIVEEQNPKPEDAGTEEAAKRYGREKRE